MKIEPWMLQQRQGLPLELKIAMSQSRIRDWYNHFGGDVYVSFSGGKDSTVLRDLVNNTPGVYDVPSAFCDTGLEYPEVRKHAMKYADVILRPAMTFKQVIERYGYPFPSKEQARYIRDIRHSNSEKLRTLRLYGSENGRFKVSEKWMPLIDAPFEVSEQCCDVMKKRPFHKYEAESKRHPYIGTMAAESTLRKQQYLQDGCNAFDAKRPHSNPLGFWTEQDVLRYLKTTGIEYPSVYGDIITADLFGDILELTGEKRTGCMFCMFGVQFDGCPNRFERMKETHPKQYEYCMGPLGLADVLSFPASLSNKVCNNLHETAEM